MTGLFSKISSNLFSKERTEPLFNTPKLHTVVKVSKIPFTAFFVNDWAFTYIILHVGVKFLPDFIRAKVEQII